MRLTLDAAPGADVIVADDGSTVSGVAVPFDTVGHTAAGPVRFRPGSIPTTVDADSDPVPFCLDHDTTRPIGVVAELVDDGAALRFTATLDPVPDAQHARAQMRSRSRPGISVGVDVHDYTVDPDGTLDVVAGELVELSSVVRPAFSAARVAASSAPTERTDPTMSTSTSTLDAAAPAVAAALAVPAVPDDVPARLPAHIAAAAPRIPRTVIEAGAAVRTRLGGDATAATVRAALADMTTVTAPGVTTFVDELDLWVAEGTPLVEAFSMRSVDSSAPIMQRRWKVRPVPGKQTAEKTQIATNPASWEYIPVTPETYAWGVDVSVQVLDASGESVLDDIARAATEEVAAQIETAAAAIVVAGATAGPATVTIESVGEAIGMLGKHNADVLVAAPDVFGALWASLSTGGPGVSRIAGDFPTPRLVKSSAVPAGFALLGDRRAFMTTWSGTSQLRAVEVSLLGVNVGVYRYATHELRIPAGVVKLGAAPAVKTAK